MKIVIKDNWAKNLGDVAIAESMISQMREVFPDCKITLESSHPEITKEYFKDIKIVRRLFDVSNIKYAGEVFSLKFFLSNIPFIFQTIDTFISSFIFVFLKQKKSKFEILNEIKNADLVLSAGGDFLSAKYAYRLRFFEYLLIKRLKKPLILYAQSIGPFPKMSIPLVRYTLNKVDAIFGRDEKTISLLSDYGVISNVYRTADSVILLKINNSLRAEKLLTDLKIDSNTVMIVVRDTKFTDIKEKDHITYISGIAETIIYLKSLNYKIVFLAPNEEDLSLSKKMNKDFDLNLPIVDTRSFLPSEVKFILSNIKFLISARMHPMIIASTAGTPVISTGYEFKMSNYMKLINMSEYYLNMTPFDKEDLFKKIENLSTNYTEIKSNLKDSVAEITELSTNNLEYLKKIINNKVSNESIKIAFYMTTVLEHGGGMEKFLIETASYFSKKLAVDVDIITMDDYTTQQISNLLRFYNFKKKRTVFQHKESTESIKKYLGAVNYIKCRTFKQLKEKLNEYDVVYSKNEVLEAFIFKFILKYKNIPPIIFGCHTPIYYPTTASLQSKLHNFLYNGYIYKFLASEVNKFHVLNSSDEIRVKKLFLNKEVVKIHNPINVNLLEENSKKNPFPSEINSNLLQISWVGRLTEQKGVDDLIKIIEKINSSQMEKIEWNICGDGPKKELVENIAKKYSNVHFYGHVENMYIANLLSKSNLFLSTSKWEGHPINILEAQGMGIPVLGYDIPGVNDIVINNETGWLAKNISNLCEDLNVVINNKKQFKDIKERTASRFSPEMSYNQLNNILKL